MQHRHRFSDRRELSTNTRCKVRKVKVSKRLSQFHAFFQPRERVFDYLHECRCNSLYFNQLAAVYFPQSQQQPQSQAAVPPVVASGAPPSQPRENSGAQRRQRSSALRIVNPDTNRDVLTGEEVPPSAAPAIAALAEQATAVVGDKAGSDEPASNVPPLVAIDVQEEEVEEVEAAAIEQVETEVEPVTVAPADQVVEAAGQVETEQLPHPVDESTATAPAAVVLPPVEAVVAIEEEPALPSPQENGETTADDLVVAATATAATSPIPASSNADGGDGNIRFF